MGVRSESPCGAMSGPDCREHIARFQRVADERHVGCGLRKFIINFAKRSIMGDKYNRIGRNIASLVGTCLQRAHNASAWLDFDKMMAIEDLELAKLIEAFQRRLIATGH